MFRSQLLCQSKICLTYLQVKNKKLAIYCQAVEIKLLKIDIIIIGRCYPRNQFDLVECTFHRGVEKTRSKVSEEASKALLDDRLVP